MQCALGENSKKDSEIRLPPMSGLQPDPAPFTAYHSLITAIV